MQTFPGAFIQNCLGGCRERPALTFLPLICLLFIISVPYQVGVTKHKWFLRQEEHPQKALDCKKKLVWPHLHVPQGSHSMQRLVLGLVCFFQPGDPAGLGVPILGVSLPSALSDLVTQAGCEKLGTLPLCAIGTCCLSV